MWPLANFATKTFEDLASCRRKTVKVKIFQVLTTGEPYTWLLLPGCESESQSHDEDGLAAAVDALISTSYAFIPSLLY